MQPRLVAGYLESLFSWPPAKPAPQPLQPSPGPSADAGMDADTPRGCLSFPGGWRGCGWLPSSCRCQVHLARTVSGRGAVVQCILLCTLGLQILPCASQYHGPVNINGNGNRRRLLPAPGAGRADEWGRGLLHTASQLSACFLQSSLLCWTRRPRLGFTQPALTHAASL